MAEYIETRLSEMTVTQNVSESLKGVPKKIVDREFFTPGDDNNT